jgi:hypothetical protein
MKMSIDGGEVQEIFPDSQTADAFPSVSPDGKMLAYTSQSFDTKNLSFNSIVRIAVLEGETFKNLGKELNQNLGYHYKWTPDNKGLIYFNKEGVPNIFTISLDGGTPKQLTNFNSGVILNFDTSRDGKRLYIVRGIVNADLILIKENNNNAKTS